MFMEHKYVNKWKMLPPVVESNPYSGFECNICLDLVQDPVVTFCGHLYCWPCIYRWISFGEDDDDDEDPLTVEYDQKQPQHCPVCKTEVSEKTVIPLYGRGRQNTNSSKGLDRINIPQRPPSPNSALVHHHHRNNYNLVRPSGGSYINLGWSRHLVDPMIGMFGEMVYSRIFGNSGTTSSLYTYPDSYRGLAGSISPRFQRYMMEADKSLGRVCFFLWCCVILCLLLF
ncbi:hypothetical protein ACP275_08G106900 [Erythranthe tilingii]